LLKKEIHRTLRFHVLHWNKINSSKIRTTKKARTKIKMKTRIRISLIIMMLMAAAGLFYAANPTFFAFVNFPTGMAASSTQLLVSEYCRPQIDSISSTGVVTPFATVPGNVGECKERYLAIAPAVGTWTPSEIYATDGAAVYKITPDGSSVTLFTTVASCGNDHTGITFDHVGTFGFDMILTCLNGEVWRVNPAGTSTHVASVGTELEGPAVAPLSFGTYAGQILAANDDMGQVWAVKNDGTFTLAFSWAGAESVHVIPNTLCNFGNSGGAFFSALQQANQVDKFPATDFLGFGGDILIVSEAGGGISKVHWNGSSYVQTTFDTNPFGYEGSAFVDCDIPTPTPTPTPTATFTPTPTPTATATATPTPTPTPTVTPTTCGSSFVIGDLDAVVGHKVTFWGAQWWKQNHLSGGRAPASFKGFANCTNPNPPACGGTWQSDPGNSSHPPDTVPADMTVIVSSLITKSGPIESGDIPMMVTIHTDPGYGPNPGHEGTGTVTAVVCGSAPHPRQPRHQ